MNKEPLEVVVSYADVEKYLLTNIKDFTEIVLAASLEVRVEMDWLKDHGAPLIHASLQETFRNMVRKGNQYASEVTEVEMALLTRIIVRTVVRVIAGKIISGKLEGSKS